MAQLTRQNEHNDVDKNGENGFVYCNCGCWEYDLKEKLMKTNINGDSCTHCDNGR